ncbi:type II toxin-antitoxin system VapC family toxin [Conexibacter woesei]|uniref:PilT protein domain protein n=1 Tax=Conexibacter woesei (strain DSM 14684 / CCUG 47730 / CIP 108061 / JCM 11494 / NBRC 100937 / ID131577) TaxID=469383 RepID=D3FF68_CONWI|nr:type II toxin-antitoxin system VapC family toxin [Conexibacter woesei]ADB51785.1 PilT protein domain protein [Conexibacter woesei DSM 14684]
MKLLPDTHTVLWWAHDPSRLSSIATDLLADRRNEVLLSSAVAWEISIKTALGKLTARPGLVAELVRHGGRELPVTIAHADAAGALPHHHRDPFDRMLVAQALNEGAVLVSSDPLMRAYEAPVLW